MSHDHNQDDSDTDRRTDPFEQCRAETTEDTITVPEQTGVGKSHQLARYLAAEVETDEFVDPKGEEADP